MTTAAQDTSTEFDGFATLADYYDSIERVEVAEHRVPGTDILISIVKVPADPRLCRVLKIKPGQGKSVDRWEITRSPGTSTKVNYLHTSRTSLDEARAEANFLWADSVKRTTVSPFDN